MNTLIVKYLPSGHSSNTKKLLDLFMEQIPASSNVEQIDLLEYRPPVFSEKSLEAYITRNYMGQDLTPAQQELLKEHDRLIKQLKSADVLVMSYPMHNFSMPGIVKSYFDAIMFSGETFKMSSSGVDPVMNKLKALTLYTSGSEYPQEKVSADFPYWDALSALAKIEFSFMGAGEHEAFGVSLRDPSKVTEKLESARNKFQELSKRWYQL
ncbi:MAG: NAD(P)H-dependent oxidoreductase [Bacteriovoracaceae bacterium]|nr:NAD(P)H-dependent oxidoreductase [Bacteriovoracaceae bacterium]